MRTIWLNGIRHPQLGQFDWGSLISTVISTGIKGGVEWYGAKEAADAAKKAKEAAQAQAAAAQAAAQAQQNQAAAQAMQQAAAAPVGGTAANQVIPGVSNTALYVGAGVLGLGILVVAFTATRRSSDEEPAKKNGGKK